MTTADLSSLLASGGDGRLLRSEDGLNRYGCRFEPEAGLLPLGSCTASTISDLGFDTARQRHADVTRGGETVEEAYRDVRRRLVRSLVPDARVTPDAVLMPSGTDAEFIPLLLALAEGAAVTNVVMAPTEVGSGTMAASEFRHFDTTTPAGPTVHADDPVETDIADRVEAARIPVRNDGGEPLDPDEIDRRTRHTVDRAIRSGRSVLLHVVAHSKTGVHAPSLEYVRRAAAEHGERLHVVVDAAQGRISRRGLAEAIDSNWCVIFTGSKFFGGPPFSGAVLVPAGYRDRAATLPFPRRLGAYCSSWQAPDAWRRWRDGAPVRSDIGVLLRWSAAIAEIENYYGHDDRLRYRVLRAFDEAASTRLGDPHGVRLEGTSPSILDNTEARLLESNRTVFSFALADRRRARIDAHGLRRIQRELRAGASRPDRAAESDVLRIQIGQPVTVAPDGRAVLRIALGAPLLRRYATAAPDDPTAMIADDLDLTVRWLRDLSHR